jgi:TetR/AcrR family transcriptional regulator, transcriptional repressor for nem operon
MAGTDLTHGVFYSYFGSKSDLYAEVLGCFFTDPDWKNCWEGIEVDLAAAAAGPHIVRAYLSRQHYEDIENSCPMVLPSDVARSNKKAKRAFETVFKAMVDIWSGALQATTVRAERQHRPLPPCVWEGWSSHGPWWTTRWRMNFARHARESRSRLARGARIRRQESRNPS